MTPQMPAHKIVLAPQRGHCFGRLGGVAAPLVVGNFFRTEFLQRYNKLPFQQFAVLLELLAGLLHIPAALIHGLEDAGHCQLGYSFAVANPLPVSRLVQLTDILIKAEFHLVERQETAFQALHFEPLRLQKAVSVQRRLPGNAPLSDRLLNPRLQPKIESRGITGELELTKFSQLNKLQIMDAGKYWLTNLR